MDTSRSDAAIQAAMHPTSQSQAANLLNYQRGPARREVPLPILAAELARILNEATLVTANLDACIAATGFDQMTDAYGIQNNCILYTDAYRWGWLLERIKLMKEDARCGAILHDLKQNEPNITAADIMRLLLAARKELDYWSQRNCEQVSLIGAQQAQCREYEAEIARLKDRIIILEIRAEGRAI